MRFGIVFVMFKGGVITAHAAISLDPTARAFIFDAVTADSAIFAVVTAAVLIFAVVTAEFRLSVTANSRKEVTHGDCSHPSMRTANH